MLDSRGRLVGVNGRLKYPLAGIEVFTFVDGSVPSEVVFREMEALSWGIPIDRFQQEVSSSTSLEDGKRVSFTDCH